MRSLIRNGLGFLALLAASTALGGQVQAQNKSQSDILKLVPAEMRERGVLRVGSPQTYPPVEFHEPNTTEVIGASRDLLEEVAKRLNLKLEYIKNAYAALIPGLESGRFDVASGGISDNEERQQKVDFVNYLKSGAAMLVLANNPATYKTIDDFCGRSVALQAGSHVIGAAVEAGSERCVKAGKMLITIKPFPNTADGRMQVDLKRVEAYLGDYPNHVHVMSQLPGKYRIVDNNYILTSYIVSWAFAKNATSLRDAIHATMQGMFQDGTYKKTLDKWGIGGGALPEITINVPASKRG